MQIGFIGLGKMGLNMCERLITDGHEIVVYDVNVEAIQKASEKGCTSSTSIDEMVNLLPERKIIWLMVPSGNPVDETINKLIPLLNKGDIIVDGGNSFYKHSQERAKILSEKNINFIDCGVSGGIWGLKEGYSLMSGGNKQANEYLYPIFKSLAPEKGYTYCGESGAGHYVKMIHNGIEYGMMQSYAEGFELLQKSSFNLNLAEIASGWKYGSVVRSWLLDLLYEAINKNPKLEGIKDIVEDSGEGRWTVDTAIELGVPAHIISGAVFNRFQSQQDESFGMKILAVLRNEFGGHKTFSS